MNRKKNIVDNVSDNSVNEYSSDSDGSKFFFFFLYFLKACPFFVEITVFFRVFCQLYSYFAIICY